MRAIYAAVLVAAFATSVSSTAMAGKWAQNHPRRAEVNATPEQSKQAHK